MHLSRELEGDIMTKNQKLWTEEEDLFLKEQYGRMTLQKIGECLTRSKESVNKRV